MKNLLFTYQKEADSREGMLYSVDRFTEQIISERKVEMLAVDVDRKINLDGRDIFPPVVQIQPDQELATLLAELSHEIPWGERQAAAKKVGALRDPEALPALLAALPENPFWMVRCEIIQALERIGDAAAVSTLCSMAKNDSFQVVRSYAAKAVERLSQ
jgi:HEAT repeat protein